MFAVSDSIFRLDSLARVIIIMAMLTHRLTVKSGLYSVLAVSLKHFVRNFAMPSSKPPVPYQLPSFAQTSPTFTAAHY